MYNIFSDPKYKFYNNSSMHHGYKIQILTWTYVWKLNNKINLKQHMQKNNHNTIIKWFIILWFLLN